MTTDLMVSVGYEDAELGYENGFGAVTKYETTGADNVSY